MSLTELDDGLVRRMAIGAVFSDFGGKIHSLGFHRTDDILVTSSEDDSLRLFDIANAKQVKITYHKKHGTDRVCFTHHPSSLICSSRYNLESGESLRYLSMYDNRILRYFKGHKDRVVSLCMSPINDRFMSGSLDRSVRLWDLRVNACQGILHLRGRPAVAFDQQGLVFAIAMEGGAVKLFDSRCYDKHYRPAGKKKEGNAARYMTRSQALKHLQVNLNLFRRLCIVKGIFPREPKKKVKGNHHTYYHVKDIAFLMHEPLLEKFREIKTYQKKVKKAKAKKNEELARLLLTRQPTYKLDRLIRERYSTFIDALRDLDDCLTMVHLFAVLSASDRENLEVKRVHNCRRLSHEWQAYISRCHALRKVFVSVKGIYYQAELEGQKITWLTPHAIQQVFTNDVDFGVLLTFLEFYETLLAFINFKLYHSLNVKYPPILDSRLEALAADLYALSRYIDASSRGMTVEPKVDASSSSQSNDREESELRLAQLQHQLPSSDPGALMHLVADNNKEVEEDEETRVCKSLFKDLKFFLSREVPRESLLFVLPAFGGMVSWEGEGAPFKEDDESITHHIIDKPSAGHVYLSREYVQPQWIYDCVNARIILPTEKYLVGSIPPPHLSPFVDNEAEGYVPDYAETIKRLQAAARNEVLPLPGVGKEDLEDPQYLLYAGVMSRAEEAEAAKIKKKMAAKEKQYHEELKMELKGSKVVVAPVVAEGEEGDESVPDATDKRIAEEEANMSTVLMACKNRKLYEAMKRGRDMKKQNVEVIEQRKKKLNDAQAHNFIYL